MSSGSPATVWSQVGGPLCSTRKVGPTSLLLAYGRGSHPRQGLQGPGTSVPHPPEAARVCVILFHTHLL